MPQPADDADPLARHGERAAHPAQGDRAPADEPDDRDAFPRILLRKSKSARSGHPGATSKSHNSRQSSLGGTGQASSSGKPRGVRSPRSPTVRHKDSSAGAWSPPVRRHRRCKSAFVGVPGPNIPDEEQLSLLSSLRRVVIGPLGMRKLQSGSEHSHGHSRQSEGGTGRGSTQGGWASEASGGGHERGGDGDGAAEGKVEGADKEESGSRSSGSLEGKTEELAAESKYVDVTLLVFHRTNPLRRACIYLAGSGWFESLVVLVILANCAFLAMYDPLSADDEGRNLIISEAEIPFTAFFIGEMVIKIIAMGFVADPRCYLRDPWNVMDFLVVVGSILGLLPSLNGNVSSVRTVRVLRPLRTITLLPGMRVLVGTILRSLPMLGNVILLCVFLFLVFGILGVQLFAGSLDKRCFLREPAPCARNISAGLNATDDASIDPTSAAECNRAAPWDRNLLSDYDNGTTDAVYPWQGATHSGYALADESVCTNTSRPWPGNMCDATQGLVCLPYQNPNYGITSFDDFIKASVAIYQVISLEGWTDLMYQCMDGTSGWAFIYFVALVFFGSFFLLNLALAVITEVYDDIHKEIGVWERIQTKRRRATGSTFRARALKYIQEHRFIRACFRTCQSMMAHEGYVGHALRTIKANAWDLPACSHLHTVSTSVAIIQAGRRLNGSISNNNSIHHKDGSNENYTKGNVKNHAKGNINEHGNGGSRNPEGGTAKDLDGSRGPASGDPTDGSNAGDSSQAGSGVNLAGGSVTEKSCTSPKVSWISAGTDSLAGRDAREGTGGDGHERAGVGISKDDEAGKNGAGWQHPGEAPVPPTANGTPSGVPLGTVQRLGQFWRQTAARRGASRLGEGQLVRGESQVLSESQQGQHGDKSDVYRGNRAETDAVCGIDGKNVPSGRPVHTRTASFGLEDTYLVSGHSKGHCNDAGPLVGAGGGVHCDAGEYPSTHGQDARAATLEDRHTGWGGDKASMSGEDQKGACGLEKGAEYKRDKDESFREGQNCCPGEDKSIMARQDKCVDTVAGEGKDMPASGFGGAHGSTRAKSSRRGGLGWLRQLHGFRCACARVTEHRAFGLFMLAVILLNTLALALEYDGMDEQFKNALDKAGLTFTLIFIVEMALKVAGLGIRAYVADRFNLFDAIVVILSIVDLVVSASQGQGGSSSDGGAFTALRTFRILRILKVVRSWRSLQRYLLTIYRTLVELGNFALIVGLLVFIYALLGMQIFGGHLDDLPDGLPRHHFDDVLWASVTVFQVLTGEGWNEVMYDAVRGTSLWAQLYFISLLVIGNYLVINLFLAILLSNLASDDSDRARKLLANAGAGEGSSRNSECGDSATGSVRSHRSFRARAVRHAKRHSKRIAGQLSLYKSTAANHISQYKMKVSATYRGRCCLCCFEDPAGSLTRRVWGSMSAGGGRKGGGKKEGGGGDGEGVTEPHGSTRAADGGEFAGVELAGVGLREADGDERDEGRSAMGSEGQGRRMGGLARSLSLGPPGQRGEGKRGVAGGPDRCSSPLPLHPVARGSGTSSSSSFGELAGSALGSWVGAPSPHVEEGYSRPGGSAPDSGAHRSDAAGSHGNGADALSGPWPGDASSAKYQVGKGVPDASGSALDASTNGIGSHSALMGSLSLTPGSAALFVASISSQAPGEASFTSPMSSSSTAASDSHVVFWNKGTPEALSPKAQAMPRLMKKSMSNPLFVPSPGQTATATLASDVASTTHQLPFANGKFVRQPSGLSNKSGSSDAATSAGGPVGDGMTFQRSTSTGRVTFSRSSSLNEASVSGAGVPRPANHPRGVFSRSSSLNENASGGAGGGPHHGGRVLTRMASLASNSSAGTATSASPRSSEEGYSATTSDAGSEWTTANNSDEGNSVRRHEGVLSPRSPGHNHGLESALASQSNSAMELTSRDLSRLGSGRSGHSDTGGRGVSVRAISFLRRKVRSKVQRQPNLLRFLSRSSRQSSVGPDGRSSWHSGAPQPYDLYKGRSLWLFSTKGRLRRWCFLVTDDRRFSMFIIAIILASSLSLACESPGMLKNKTRAHRLDILDLVFSCLFMGECVLKIVAWGAILNKGAYLRSKWNVSDLIIAVASLLPRVIPGGQDVSWVRAVRTLRVMRPLRLVTRVPELRVVVNALIRSMSSLWNVVVVALLFWLIFGILGMQLFMGKMHYCTDEAMEGLPRANCTGVEPSTGELRRWYNNACNFDNILNAMLCLFEMATTEGWTDVMYAGVDAVGVGIALKRDTNEGYALFFVLFMVLGSFFIVNMFVGNIVDNFARQRASMEIDNLFMTDAQRTWVDTIRKGMQQSLTPLPPARSNNRILRLLNRLVNNPRFEQAIMLLIVLNIGFLAARHHNQGARADEILDTANLVFTALYALEAALKIAAHGPRYYFGAWWNRFDFLLVVFSFVGLFTSTNVASNIFRVFRITRLFRMVRYLSGLRTLFTTLVISAPTLANTFGLLAVLFFVFAVLGVQLFANVRLGDELNEYSNFRNFGYSILTLLRMVTGEGWNGIMYDCMKQPPGCEQEDNCGLPQAWIYFVAFVVLGSFVTLNLFIAVVLENFSSSKMENENQVSVSHLAEFRKVWVKRFDPEASNFIPLAKFEELLRAIPPPLGVCGKPMSAYDMMLFQRGLFLPVCDGFIYYHDVLNTLTQRAMGLSIEELPQEVRDALQKETERRRQRAQDQLEEKKRARRTSRARGHAKAPGIRDYLSSLSTGLKSSASSPQLAAAHATPSVPSRGLSYSSGYSDQIYASGRQLLMPTPEECQEQLAQLQQVPFQDQTPPPQDWQLHASKPHLRHQQPQGPPAGEPVLRHGMGARSFTWSCLLTVPPSPVAVPTHQRRHSVLSTLPLRATELPAGRAGLAGSSAIEWSVVQEGRGGEGGMGGMGGPGAASGSNQLQEDPEGYTVGLEDVNPYGRSTTSPLSSLRNSALPSPSLGHSRRTIGEASARAGGSGRDLAAGAAASSAGTSPNGDLWNADQGQKSQLGEAAPPVVSNVSPGRHSKEGPPGFWQGSDGRRTPSLKILALVGRMLHPTSAASRSERSRQGRASLDQDVLRDMAASTHASVPGHATVWPLRHAASFATPAPHSPSWTQPNQGMGFSSTRMLSPSFAGVGGPWEGGGGSMVGQPLYLPPPPLHQAISSLRNVGPLSSSPAASPVSSARNVRVPGSAPPATASSPGALANAAGGQMTSGSGGQSMGQMSNLGGQMMGRWGQVAPPYPSQTSSPGVPSPGAQTMGPVGAPSVPTVPASLRHATVSVVSFEMYSAAVYIQRFWRTARSAVQRHHSQMQRLEAMRKQNAARIASHLKALLAAGAALAQRDAYAALARGPGGGEGRARRVVPGNARPHCRCHLDVRARCLNKLAAV
eukprot:jgi/Mesvir1/15730/Mv03304-RA.1